MCVAFCVPITLDPLHPPMLQNSQDIILQNVFFLSPTPHTMMFYPSFYSLQLSSCVLILLEHFPFVWKNQSFWWNNKWNSPSHWEFFRKKGIASDVVLFSRFYHLMTGILLNYLPRSHLRTMLLVEIRGLFLKITSGKNLIPQRNNCFFQSHCSIWRKIVTGFSI